MAIEKKSRDEVEAWLQMFHKISDSLNSDGLHAVYAKDATLIFGNNPPTVGLDNIIKSFDGVYPLLESMKHEVVDFDLVGNKLYIPCNVTYVVKNDPKQERITVPAMGIGHFKEEDGKDKFERFQVYLDVSKLFERVGEVAALGKGE